jgi:hypothetical protein
MGFSDTAETVDYLEKPEIQLNTWSYDDDEVYAHYSAAYLLSLYVWEQLGQTAVQELARHRANGLASVKAVVEGHTPEMTLEQFLADWAVANYLDSQNDPNPDPRYSYQHLNIDSPRIQHKVGQGGAFEEVETLAQFGVHYLDLTELRGETTISIAGDRITQLIASEMDATEKFWYTPPVDEVNASLRQAFDLTNESQANLTYSVWYDLEEDYDYAFVSISTDGGTSWVKLQPAYAESEDDGYGYNGRSTSKKDEEDGWLTESISLAQFVGHNVIIRFDVLTDSAITGQGFAPQNIAVTGSDNASTGADEIEGWQAEGFVFTNWQLPQKWSVTLLTTDPDSRNVTVTPLALNDQNQAQAQLDFGKDGGVLIIMPQTPFILEPANYWLKVTQ